jgi:sterol 3beta-glucosyltransferase
MAGKPSAHPEHTEGMLMNYMTAIFGLPGYTLKGIERELSKHRLTTLQAELCLIRLRQANHDFERATQDEKRKVVEQWKRLQQAS